jgi:hypothetical protein
MLRRGWEMRRPDGFLHSKGRTGLETGHVGLAMRSGSQQVVAGPGTGTCQVWGWCREEEREKLLSGVLGRRELVVESLRGR